MALLFGITRFKADCPTETDAIETLEQVILMTPENTAALQQRFSTERHRKAPKGTEMFAAASLVLKPAPSRSRLGWGRPLWRFAPAGRQCSPSFGIRHSPFAILHAGYPLYSTSPNR
jgi:hypothetical protein